VLLQRFEGEKYITVNGVKIYKEVDNSVVESRINITKSFKMILELP
jgi:hypothetical protein